MERFRYDRSSKWLIDHVGNLILYLGNVRDIEEWRTTQAEVVQPRQLPDGLLEVRRKGEKRFHPFIIEIETYPDQRTPEDLFDDIMLVYQDRREVPDVLALILHPKGKAQVDNSVELGSRGGFTKLFGSWKVVELWTLSATDLLAANEPGLVPWISLTHIDGPVEPVLRQARRIIDDKAPTAIHANLLAVTQVFMGLNYNDPRLFAIFGGDEAMIESPVLQRFLTENLAKRMHRAILGVLETRFGPVSADLVALLATIVDDERLQQINIFAASAASIDEFRQKLGS